MGYLHFNNNIIINEGLKSIAFNTIKTGIKLGTSLTPIGKTQSVYNLIKNHNLLPDKNIIFFHKIDTKFFDSLYFIPKKLNDQIFEWCFKTGATLLSSYNIKNTNFKYINIKDKNAPIDYENDLRKKSLNKDQSGLLNKSFNLDSITKRIYDKSHKFFYLVNFIFNDKSIKKIELINISSTSISYHNLKEWKKIKLEEYKK